MNTNRRDFLKRAALAAASAALAGTPGQVPADSEVDAAFEAMVEDLKQGRLERYIPFDRDGQPVQIG